LGWKDIDVGACPSLPLADRGLMGRTDGGARMRVSPRAGEGQIAIREASWQVLPAIRLRLDPASLRWALSDGSVTVSDIAVDGPDLQVRRAGTVRLAAAAARRERCGGRGRSRGEPRDGRRARGPGRGRAPAARARSPRRRAGRRPALRA